MMNWFRNIINPTLEDPDEAQRQYLLNLVLLSLGLPGFLFGIVSAFLWAIGRAPAIGAISGIGVQFFYIIAFWLGRRGKVRLASLLPIFAVFLVMTGAGLQIGIGHSTLIGFAMATLTAGLLVGPAAGYIFAFASALLYYATGLYQLNDRIPIPLSPESSLGADVIGVLFGLIVLVAFTQIYLRQLQTAFRSEHSLSAQLRDHQSVLETEVQRRTDSLERRMAQIHAAAEVSRVISAVLEPEQLLSQVVNLIQERFKLYYAGVFLADEEMKFATLHAGTEEAGKMMVQEGHKLAIGDSSMIGWAIAHLQPRIALDVGQEAVRFENPYLPLTRSELALPIVAGERVLGALTIQSEQPSAFDQDDIIALQGIADTLAIALENARLFKELQANLQEIQSLHGQYLQDAWMEKTRTAGEIQYTYGDPIDTEKASVDIPLTLREQIIGRLSLEGEDEWSPEEKTLIEAVATQAVLALENARLLDETRLHAQREETLASISSKIRSSLDMETVLQTAVKEIGRALGLADVEIHLAESGAKQEKDSMKI